MKTFVNENIYKTKMFNEKVHKTKTFYRMKTFMNEKVHKTSYENNTRCHKVGFKFRLKRE